MSLVDVGPKNNKTKVKNEMDCEDDEDSDDGHTPGEEYNEDCFFETSERSTQKPEEFDEAGFSTVGTDLRSQINSPDTTDGFMMQRSHSHLAPTTILPGSPASSFASDMTFSQSFSPMEGQVNLMQQRLTQGNADYTIPHTSMMQSLGMAPLMLYHGLPARQQGVPDQVEPLNTSFSQQTTNVNNQPLDEFPASMASVLPQVEYGYTGDTDTAAAIEFQQSPFVNEQHHLPSQFAQSNWPGLARAMDFNPFTSPDSFEMPAAERRRGQKTRKVSRAVVGGLGDGMDPFGRGGMNGRR